MRVIVTGATGFIGRRVTSQLLQGGYEVSCLLRPGSACPAGAAPVAVDLSRMEAIERLPSGDAVIHLAQSPLYRQFPETAGSIFSVNTASTAKLLALAQRNGTRCFVLASTGNVYSDRRGPCSEDESCQPDEFYSASKVAAEALLRPYARYFHTCTLRLFTPYGPGQRDRLVPTLVARVRSRRPVELDGEAGGLQLSLAYVGDVATVFGSAAEQCWQGVYNVAAPRPASIAEIATVIGRELGVEPLFKRTGRPQPASLVADVSRLAQLQNVPKFRDLEEGIRLTLLGTGVS
jgi:nucleoside-diphosphate-sugar epimerase